MSRICPILLLCLTFCVSYGQQIVNDVIGSSGEQISNTNIIIEQTSGELVTTTINNSEIILTQGFQQTSQIFYISPIALLQGATIGTSDGLMRDNLRTGNYLPTTSPHNTTVKESNNAFTVSGDNAIVDWVTVKLRNSNNRIISEKSALVQRDGDIVSADGTSPIQLTPQNKNYYVEINHRNHLGVMTKNLINFDTTSLLDFTDASLLTYGNNGRAELTSGTMGLWAGNTNGDNFIRYFGPNNDANQIKDNVLGNPSNSINSNFYPLFGYDNADIDMNGIVRYFGPNNDTNILKDIILSNPSNTIQSNFFPIIQQTPN